MNFSENSHDWIGCEDIYHWIGCEIITENGEPLGCVKNIILSSEDNSPIALIISILPILWLPKVITGSYSLSTSEIVSSGPNRLIVFEDAENRIVCQTVSWLERIGLVKPPWFQKDDNYYHDNYDDGNNYEEDDDDSPGISSTPKPRKPGPSPLNAEAKIQVDDSAAKRNL